jgi:hypothetical protein
METPITHPQLVKQLAKPGEAILASLTPVKAHLLHMAVGVSGEAAELIEAFSITPSGQVDRENLVEELGDLKFYIEGMLQGLGAVSDDLCPRTADTKTPNKVNKS